MARAFYIHWPFCLKRCPYCDFNSHVRAEVDVARWQSALIADMHHEAEVIAETTGIQPLSSIFFGGGTPSLMPPALVAALLAEAERLWGFAPDIEITLEANPSSVEAGRFADLAATGVNRISLGLQSFDDAALHFLGRLHNAEEGLAALKVAQTHFSRVSFDLIYARPGQDKKAWQAELARALDLGTGHLSLYQLTIEAGTRFATDVRQKIFTPLNDDPAADLFALTSEMTDAAGLPAYEVSNHARKGEASRHNLAYWRYLDYSGIGPGAHGRRGACATQRHRKPENWLGAIDRNGHGIETSRELSPDEQASEALLMGLRLAEGVDPDQLGQRLGIPGISLINQDKLSLYTDLGLVWHTGSRVGVSQRGMPLLDALIADLVPDTLVSA